jgi:hypothetical protein
MSKFIQAAAIAAVLLVGAFSARAHAVSHTHKAPPIAHNPSSSWTDMSKPYGGYDPNSPEGNRAFWDYRARQGSGR